MKYIDANGVEQTADNATEITTNTTTLTAEQGDKWYYVTGTVDLTSDPSLITSISLSGSGTAHLILGDGATLKATGISNSATTDEATSLVIYAQSTGDNAGTLDITNSNSSASIFVKGGVTINGGTVNVETTSENGGAYIRSDNGDVEINGGKVNIDSENSGTYIQGNSVTINGGKVNIDSYNSEAYIRSNSGNVTINGGKVNIDSENSGAYIKSDSGNVEITYGTVNVKGATLAYISSNGGTVTINGSTVAVEGTGDNAGAYIMTTGDNGTVTINGGQIKITGTGSQTSGIICGSIKSINLDYQDIKYDFILTSGYWCSASTGNTFIYPIIASGKAFAVMGGEEFTDFERFINSTNYTEFNYATLLKDKKLVPALTVTFDANDGTSAPATQTQNVRYEIDSTLTANTFTRTGYTFKGWNTQADGSGTSYADKANVTLTADTTLYAQWQQQETTPPAATLSTIEVSVTGESTLSTTEGTATTSAYTASVTGKYSDGTSKTLSASDYSLEWTLDRDISGISINNGTFSVNDSVSAGEYTLTITAKATQGSVTGSGTQSVNLTVSEKQEQQQEQQQETTPPAVTLSTIEVSVTGALTLETTEGTATTSAYTATVTGKYSDGMSKTLTDYSVEWTLDKNISGIQISNNGTLSVNNSVKAGEYKLTITAKATQDSVTGSGTRSVNLTVSEKQQEQQQEQQEEQKQENTPATVTLESVGVSITGSDTLTVTEYETLTATYTVTLTYSPYLKARDSGLNKPAHV